MWELWHNCVVLTLILFISAGVHNRLTCDGCEPNDERIEYYCKGTERHIHFRCQSDTNQLIWDVSPLLSETVSLNGLSPEDNIIRKPGGVNVFVDEVNVGESVIEIISYLWFNLETVKSELTVSCDNGDFQEWTLKPLGMCI